MAPSPGKRRSNRGGRAYAAARSHASTSTASSLPPNTAAAVASASLPASQSSPMTPLPEDDSQQSLAPDMSPSSPAPPRPMRGIKRRKPGHPTPLVEQAAAKAAKVASSGSGQPRHADANVEAEDPEAVREQNLFDGWKEEYHDIVEQLPLEIHRSFALIHELEGQVKGHMATISREALAYTQHRLAKAHALQTNSSGSGPSSHASGSGSGSGEGDDDFATPPLPAMASASASASSSIDASMAGPSSAPQQQQQQQQQQPPSTPYSRHHALNRISRAIASSIASSEEKVGLALSAYQLIDRQCRRLDVELAKMTGQPTTPANANAAGAGGASAPSAVAPSGEAMRPGTMESGVSQKHTGALAKGGQEEDTSANAEASGSGSTRQMRKRKASSGGGGAIAAKPTPAAAAAPPAPEVTGTAAVDMAYDPNEPVYCYCQQPSSGAMVGCDNEEDPLGRAAGCPREWYHLACLEARGEMTQQGYEELEDSRKKWYCADCRVALGLPPVVVTPAKKKRAGTSEWVDDAEGEEEEGQAGSPKGNKRRKKMPLVDLKKPGAKKKPSTKSKQVARQQRLSGSQSKPGPKPRGQPQTSQPRGKARPVATPRAKVGAARAVPTPKAKTKIGGRAGAAARVAPSAAAANRGGKRNKASDAAAPTTPAKTRRAGGNKR